MTIQVKKDGDSNDPFNRLAVFASLFLFNRVVLRCQRLTQTKLGDRTWSSDDFESVKHYGITLAREVVKIFLILPCLDFDRLESVGNVRCPWIGCDVQHLRTYKLTDPQGVVELAGWINKIHNWGLGIHRAEFERDVFRILENKSERVAFQAKP